MKANEFIKEKGIDYAIKFLNRDVSIAEDKCELDFDEYENLKRLIDSWALVELCGGLDIAKKLDPAFLAGWVESVNKAILDVEGCQ